MSTTEREKQITKHSSQWSPIASGQPGSAVDLTVERVEHHLSKSAMTSAKNARTHRETRQSSTGSDVSGDSIMDCAGSASTSQMTTALERHLSALFVFEPSDQRPKRSQPELSQLSRSEPSRAAQSLMRPRSHQYRPRMAPPAEVRCLFRTLMYSS